MSHFLQYHVLTPFGPSNANRDDLGRHKEVQIGGTTRLRHSSQSVKRALRNSVAFGGELSEYLGVRTKRLVTDITKYLDPEGGKKAEKAAVQVAEAFGKIDGLKPKGKKSKKNAEAATNTETVAEPDANAAPTENAETPEDEAPKKVIGATMVFVSPEERQAAYDVATRIYNGEDLKPNEIKRLVLKRADNAVDIAMFGRMLANDTAFNRDAAVQVSHAFTTHATTSQDDWFSAVDDLSTDEDGGAGHIGEASFGSGVFYQYVCLDIDKLIENLNGNKTLAQKAVAALTRALTENTPTGKQNSFANHPRASYMLVESTTKPPRDLSGAFYKAIDGYDLIADSITALEDTKADLERIYGDNVDASEKFSVADKASKSCADVINFAETVVEKA